MKLNNCKNCNNCKQTYRESVYTFSKYELFYCTTSQTIVDLNYCCDNWAKRQVKYDLSPQRFDEVEHEIKAVYELLKNYPNA